MVINIEFTVYGKNRDGVRWGSRMEGLPDKPQGSDIDALIRWFRGSLKKALEYEEDSIIGFEELKIHTDGE